MKLLFLICLLVIGSACSYADAPASATSGGLMSLLPMLAFVAILYFLLIRPQQKRTKQHQALVASVKKGDKVVTNCGIMGTVSKVVSDQEVTVEIAPGVHCRFVKSSISGMISSSDTSSREISQQESSAKSDDSSEEIDGIKHTTDSTEDGPIAKKRIVKSSKATSVAKKKTDTKQ
jgi:preprotein translocase subunit YajC